MTGTSGTGASERAFAQQYARMDTGTKLRVLDMVRVYLISVMLAKGIIQESERQQLLDMPYETLLGWVNTFAKARQVTGQSIGLVSLN